MAVGWLAWAGAGVLRFAGVHRGKLFLTMVVAGGTLYTVHRWNTFEEEAQAALDDFTTAKESLLGSAGLGIGLLLIIVILLQRRGRRSDGKAITTSTTITGG